MQLPDVQLAVTEQRIRSWAAAAAQLQVQLAVTRGAAAEPASKKPGAAAAGGAKTAVAGVAAPAVAAGTLLVNCAGLLAGDTAATYQWGTPSPAATDQGQATAAAPSVDGCGPLTKQLPKLQQQQAATYDTRRFKWTTQPPSNSLQDWLASAEVHVQVTRWPGRRPQGSHSHHYP